MPPKAMSKSSILDLVMEVLAKANLTEPKSKKRIIKWDDESEEEDETQMGESFDKGRGVEMDKDQKVFLNALKLVKKDILDHIKHSSGILNGEELLDWIEAIDNHFDYKEVEEEKRVNYVKARLKGLALVWWNMMQDDRVDTRKEKIASWERMKIIMMV